MTTLDTAKQKPILFSGPMVLALLEGRKTQTRRTVKPQPDFIESSGRWRWPIPRSKVVACTEVVTASREWWEYLLPEQMPYVVGESLWVRETCKQQPIPNLLTGEPTNAMCAVYAADGESVLNERGFDYAWWYSRQSCPGIHMPRFACRLVLEVKAVRVERLQDISEADAEAEGVDRIKAKVPEHRDAYRYLWDDINGFGEWAKNPWVWVIEFKRRKESAMAIAA